MTATDATGNPWPLAMDGRRVLVVEDEYMLAR